MLTLSPTNAKRIERAFPYGSRLIKQEPGSPARQGVTYLRGKALQGAAGTTFLSLPG